MLTLKGEGLGGRGLGEDFRSHVVVWHLAYVERICVMPLSATRGLYSRGRILETFLRKFFVNTKYS